MRQFLKGALTGALLLVFTTHGYALDDATTEGAEAECLPVLSAQAAAEASLHLLIVARCHIGQRARIHHGGIEFDLTVPPDGLIKTVVPALENPATLRVTLDGTDVTSQPLPIAKLGNYIRVAMSWPHGSSVDVTARTADIPGLMRYQIGDESGVMAKVISQKIEPNPAKKVIRLMLLRHVTELGCDQDQTGRIVEIAPDAPPVRYTLTIGAPGCGHVGETLELKNILPDLKLARQ